MVMEYGMTVNIRPRNARYLAFEPAANGMVGNITSKSGLVFTKGPIKINYRRQPTFQAFSRALDSFFGEYSSKATGAALDEYATEASKAASRSAYMIKVAKPSDAYAKSVAKRMSNTLRPI